MQYQLFEGLRCPRCEGELAHLSLDGHSGDALLLCDACRVRYPVCNEVPVMLLFHTPMHAEFERKHAGVFTRLPGYDWSRLAPEPGEEAVQKTFTEEWMVLQDDELCWTYSKSELLAAHRDAFLRWNPEIPPQYGKVLNVGVGYGLESEILHEITGAEVYAVDLNLSLLQRVRRLPAARGVHFVIASLFHLPFRRGSFDLVYSVGVLHHTYSTERALRNVAGYVGEQGRLFVWLYALEDILLKNGFRGVVKVGFHAAQYVVRPILSRAPGWLRNTTLFFMSLVFHPLFSRSAGSGKRWSLRNTEHNLRDSFTPRYYYYHSFNEVVEWLEELGFQPQIASAKKYRESTGRPLDGIGILATRLANRTNDNAATKARENVASF